MEKLIRSLPLFILLLSLTNCQKEEPIVEIPVIEEPEVISSNVQIDEFLVPFFDKFEEEGRLRGFEIDLEAEGITGVIEEIAEDRVAGTCTYGTHLPGDVVIDAQFWNNSSFNFKEMVVFHELGHCFLRRGHKEAALPNGACASIMRSGTLDCIDNYNTRTRESYLDELFFSD